MSKLLAIDPGPKESGYVVLDGTAVVACGTVANDALDEAMLADECVIEMVASYGMAVGADVFETCYQAGRLAERFATFASAQRPVYRLFRRDVKLEICGDMRATDANIRQAIIDRYGGKELAIGKKAAPGPLYAVKGDAWAALALALTWRARSANGSPRENHRE